MPLSLDYFFNTFAAPGPNAKLRLYQSGEILLEERNDIAGEGSGNFDMTFYGEGYYFMLVRAEDEFGNPQTTWAESNLLYVPS